MESIVLSASIAALVSLVTMKILVARVFEIIDSYVTDMYQLTKEFVQTVERELREGSNP